VGPPEQAFRYKSLPKTGKIIAKVLFENAVKLDIGESRSRVKGIYRFE
jgi:hypothetical protein